MEKWLTLQLNGSRTANCRMQLEVFNGNSLAIDDRNRPNQFMMGMYPAHIPLIHSYPARVLFPSCL